MRDRNYFYSDDYKPNKKGGENICQYLIENRSAVGEEAAEAEAEHAASLEPFPEEVVNYPQRFLSPEKRKTEGSLTSKAEEPDDSPEQQMWGVTKILKQDNTPILKEKRYEAIERSFGWLRPHFLHENECTPVLHTPIIRRHKHYPLILETHDVASHSRKELEATHEDTMAVFFNDDYKFESVWKKLYDYSVKLRRYAAVTTPDFSTYYDFPTAVNIFNLYRAGYCGSYWQRAGLCVIPNVTWWDENSLNYAFNHIEKGCHCVVSMVGARPNNLLCDVDDFVKGVKAFLEQVEPERVYAYGNIKIPELKRLADFIELPTRYDFVNARLYIAGKRGPNWLVRKIKDDEEYRKQIRTNNALSFIRDGVDSTLRNNNLLFKLQERGVSHETTKRT